MKSTRRRLLATISSLIALPVLPRALSQGSQSHSLPSATTLRSCLARQDYNKQNPQELLQYPGAWNTHPRAPLTLAEIECREEFIHCELHGQKLTSRNPSAIRRLESALDQCQLARWILEMQPTGCPLVFHYLGGSTPQAERTVLPTLLFTINDEHPMMLTDRPATPLEPIYLHAYCIDRLAPRTFRLDRIENASPLAA